jgi:Rrf2 family protein
VTKNSRFTVAVHALALLSIVRGKPATSDYIARSVNTNPVVIRRILGVLGRAGLVETHPGAGGGSELAKDPAGITLLEIWRLMGNVDLFPMHTQPPSDDCVCGRHIQEVLSGVFADAQSALEQILAGLTIQDIEDRIEELEEIGLCEPC